MRYLAILALPLLAGCGLNPKQLAAMDGVMCFAFRGYGVENTTVVVGGASKPSTVSTSAACEVSVVNLEPKK